MGPKKGSKPKVASRSGTKRKHTDRTVIEKIRIVERVVVGGERVTDVARGENICQSTLSTWKKDLPTYRAQLAASAAVANRMRVRLSTRPFVENALVVWVIETRAAKKFNNMISLEQLLAHAKRLVHLRFENKIKS